MVLGSQPELNGFKEGVGLMSTFIAPANHSVIMSSLKEMSDAGLVSAAKSGDAVAFVELSRRHSDKILRRTYRIVKNWQDAEDVLQDSFMKAFIHLKDFEERASFSSWLTRIAINTALMLCGRSAFTLRSRPAVPTMISAFGIVGNPGILLKALKTVAHGESRKRCLREQFKGYRRYSATLFR